MRPLRVSLFLLASIALLAGCGGDSGPSGPGGGGGTGTDRLSARIDGVAWSAASQTILASGSTQPGQISFQGSSLTNPVGALAIMVSRIPGPGTYPLGVNIFSASGGTASIAVGATSANTPLDGASGSITFTSITSTRAAGTFAFVAEPLVGGGSSVVVTDGQFDVPLSAGYAPVSADEVGSSASGTLAGEEWNAATVVATASTSQSYSFNASNTLYSLNLIIGPIDGPSEGPISHLTAPLRRLTITRTGGGAWGGTGADSGTIAVTELSSARMKGTFTATLAVSTGSGDPLEIVDGEFDVRFGQ
jgi:hypothetical protein